MHSRFSHRTLATPTAVSLLLHFSKTQSRTRMKVRWSYCILSSQTFKFQNTCESQNISIAKHQSLQHQRLKKSVSKYPYLKRSIISFWQDNKIHYYHLLGRNCCWLWMVQIFSNYTGYHRGLICNIRWLTHTSKLDLKLM